MTTTTLFTPLQQVGRSTLANRIFMAPLTRARATPMSHLPTDAMVQHYADRASAGLIITECTMIAPKTSAFYSEPGVYSPEQLVAWKKVTDAVHAKGGKIFCQIWHAGRAAHPVLNNGIEPVAPSAIAIDGLTHDSAGGKVPHVVPRPLTLDEIAAIVQQFATAARNCVKEAGFDGVEVHGANGYLIDQFLKDGSNTRTDAYGGSIKNRTRFVMEILTAVVDAIDGDRVGVRFSPANGHYSMTDSDPDAVATYLAKKLNQFNLTYVHIRRDDTNKHVAIYRSLYQGVLIGNQSYTRDEANVAIVAGELDAVAFGSAFVANPDLVARFQKNAPLNAGNPKTYFVQSLEGYNDYPTLEELALTETTP